MGSETIFSVLRKQREREIIAEDMLSDAQDRKGLHNALRFEGDDSEIRAEEDLQGDLQGFARLITIR